MSPRPRESARRATAKSTPSQSPSIAVADLRAVRPPIGRREGLAIGLLFAAAVALRFAYPTRISIEHWDEAVLSSNVFLDGGYPDLFLYAPPLVPTLIEWSMLAFGKTSFAAVFPNLVFGACTVPLCWWVGREWFGPAAGLAAAALAAFCDFHILYSRTGLTDAALGFWFLLAVYCSWRALVQNHRGEALLAGLMIACAWSTKYNGWLPLAVAVSAFIAWGLFERFDRREWLARLPVIGLIALAAVVCWSPVWLSLQAEGGYSKVAQNHAQYFVGLGGWWSGLKRQFFNQQHFEAWLTACGVMLAWLLPAIMLFATFSRRGENQAENQAGGSSVIGVRPASEVLGDLDQRLYLMGWAAAFAGLSLLLGRVGFVLAFALMFVGFVVFAVANRSSNDAGSADERRSRNLAGWLLAAWFLGLTMAIPLYTPYPRLVLPWLVSAWLAAGACVQQVLAFLAARREKRDRAEQSVLPGTQTAVIGWRNWAGLVAGLVVLAIGVATRLDLARSRDVPGWQDRSIRTKVILDAARFAKKTTAGKPSFLVYGEPALFFQLAANGWDPQTPLGNFSFLAPGQTKISQPAFLLAYEETADFAKLIAPYESALDLLAVFHDTPSDLVLLDSHVPADLAPGRPRPREELRLYRIKPR